ncbi:MAG: hypothetical protein ABIR24_14345 [Verrucomicrobiota bacterium]
MSSTRHHDPNTPIDPNGHQSRYFSSPEYERGLLANAVARRCTVLKKQEDQELCMFVQARSLDVGMPALCKEIAEMFPHYLATKTMQEFGTKGKNYSAEQVRKLRGELPGADPCSQYPCRFPLKGDRPRHLGLPIIRPDHDCWQYLNGSEKDQMLERLAEEKERQAKLPSSYPVENFKEVCCEAAEANLERDLSDLCQDAAWNLNESRPWYFPNLFAALREYQTAWVAKRKKEIVETEVVSKISESLDLCIGSRSIVLVEGVSGLGKQFGLVESCALQPGRVRCVQTSPTPDDASFFRGIGRPLGVSVALSLKVQQMRERIETTLRDSGIGLAFFDAQYLFIASTHREIMYRRINWLMSMANSGTPIFLCGTPQFLETTKNAETVSMWNSAQLTKGIHYVPLPSVLSRQDLTALAKHCAPQAESETIKAMVIYAYTSGKSLAGIDAMVKCARFIAKRNGRDDITEDDFNSAFNEYVKPSANALKDALAVTGKHPKMRRVNPPQIFEAPRRATLISESEIPSRETQPLVIQ